MKAKTIVLTIVLGMIAAASAFAGDANMGTWKLNEAKSKIPAMAPKNNMVTYVAAGDSIKVTVDGTDANGKPTHNEWTGKFDGKDYPLVGDATADTRSYKKIDDHNMTIVNKKGGKTILEGKIAISADGKTRTLTASGMDSMGMKTEYTAFYDKQ
jgi:hypothetical protein